MGGGGGGDGGGRWGREEAGRYVVGEGEFGGSVVQQAVDKVACSSVILK